MKLPKNLSSTGATEKKLGEIPTGKKPSKITNALVDTRGEPDWDFGCPTIKMALPAGDVMCTCSDGCTVLVERKTPDDFLHTLKAGRLFPQVERMIQVTPWSYIIVTGLFYKLHTGKTKVGGRDTGWDWTAVQGALLTCQEMGAAVIYDSDFEGAVKRLCNRDRSAKRIAPPRETSLLTEGEAAIAALPGIGFEKVQALAKLGSPARMLEWLTNFYDMAKVPGVADGTKVKAVIALGLENGERLAIMPEGCMMKSYVPNGGFVAAADQLAMDYLEGLIENGN